MKGSRKNLLAILTVLTATVFLPTLVTAGEQVYSNEAMGINITSNQTFYNCNPNCTAQINVSNSGPINGTLQNLTVYNNFSFDASNLKMGISYATPEGQSFSFVDNYAGDKKINLTSQLGGTPIYNETDSGDPYVYQFKLNLSNDNDFGKWNFTVQLGANNSTSNHWYTNFTLDPYIQEINLHSPEDGNITNKTQPSFNISYNSGTNSSLNCSIQANTSGSYSTIAFNESTYNNTSTVINPDSPPSDGIYAWRAFCDADDDNTADVGEVSEDRSLTVDTTGPKLNFLNIENESPIGGIVKGNLSVEDGLAGVDNETVQIYLKNSTSIYSLEGEEGSPTISSNITGNIYNFTINTTKFVEGEYKLNAEAMDILTNDNFTSINVTIDNSPWIDKSTIQPENFTSQENPEIRFNISGVNAIDNSTLKTWFNGSLYDHQDSTLNFTENINHSNATILEVAFEPNNSLASNATYTVKASVNDTESRKMVNQSFSFTADFSKPNITAIDRQGSPVTNNDNDWYKDGVDLNVSCTDNISSAGSFEAEGPDGSFTSDSSPITYEADSGTEKQHDIEITCKDKAGNLVNQNTTAYIDSKGPYLDSRSPISTKTIDGTSETVEIQAVIKDNGAGLTSDKVNDQLNPEFNGNDIDADVSIEDNNHTATISFSETVEAGETYEVSLGTSYTVEDRIGQSSETISDWEFTVDQAYTTPNLGTESTDSEYEIEETDDFVIEAEPGETVTAEIDVENTGNASATVDSSASSDSSYIDNLEIDEADFTVDSGETETIEITIETTEDFEGEAEIEVEYECGNEKITKTITVKEKLGEPEISVTDYPDTVDLERGKEENITFEIWNSGGRDLEGIETGFTSFVESITPEEFDIEENANKTIKVALKAEENQSLGIDNKTFSLEGENVSTEKTLLIRVQPGDNQSKQNITTAVEDLESKIENIDNETTKSELKSLVENANTALENDNYAKAEKIAEEIQSKMTQKADEEGLDIFMIAVVTGILLVGVILSIAVYIISGGKDEKKDYSPQEKSKTSKAKEKASKAGKEATATVSNLVENIKDKFSSEKKPSEKKQETNKKKIRFER
ncbi:MAG: hypothetical protein MUP58_02705 [Candidatus Nanohaloarchaeota archaeon QJJ-9]|nr:hypothetical protein [Candidatus Nanohaloarchaeota archaeon QJJ-9]